MGYYGNGFVFLQEPDWNVLASFPSSHGFTGYAHRSEPVWLLDLWKCTGREHWPFTDLMDAAEIPSAELTPGGEAQVNVLAGIGAVVEKDDFSEAVHGIEEVRLTLALSRSVGNSVFYFAGDDELTDMAALAHDGELRSLRIRWGLYLVEWRDGNLVVTPRAVSDYPDMTPAHDVVRELKELPGVRVAPTAHPQDADPLYSAAVALWPIGDPARLLGVGTWDPFLELENDFSVVCRRECAVTKKRRAAPAPPLPPPRSRGGSSGDPVALNPQGVTAAPRGARARPRRSQRRGHSPLPLRRSR